MFMTWHLCLKVEEMVVELQISDRSSSLCCTICVCETTAYFWRGVVVFYHFSHVFRETIGHPPAMFMATKVAILSQNMIFTQS